MKSYGEKLRALVLVAAALAAVLVAGEVFSPEALGSKALRGRLVSADIKEVARIEISDKESYAIVKDGDKWFAREQGQTDSGLPVLASRVDAFLKELAAVSELPRVAASKDVWARFGLGDGAAKRLILKDSRDRTLAELFIGNYAEASGALYVRVGSKPEVYAVKSAFYGYAASGKKAWLDLRVFSDPLPVEDVQSVKVSGRIEYPREQGSEAAPAPFAATYELRRDAKKGWIVAGLDSASLDTQAVERFARLIMSMEAEDYAEDGAGSSPNRQAGSGLRVELALGGGGFRAFEVTGTPDADGRFLVAPENSSYRFLVSAWTLRNVLKTPAELSIRDAK